MKIGVLEDNPAIGGFLREALEHRGHLLSIYRNGWDFLERVIPEDSLPANKPFDAVLIDLLLPSGISGFQAIQYVRKNFPDMNIVVISAASKEQLQVVERDYPGVKAFHKPFKLRDLLAAIEAE